MPVFVLDRYEDAEAALLEYFELFYRLGMAGRTLRRMGAVEFATTLAPGLRDVLLTGKVKESTTRAKDGRRVYDAVVLDAPPTGRIGRFLNVTAETARLAKMGPIKTQSEGVASLLRSPISAVHVVTLLEEMPVQETADAVAELTAAGLPVGGIVVNATRTPLLKVSDLAAAAKGRLDRELVAAGLAAAGVRESAVDPLLAEAAEHAQRVTLEKSERRTLKSLDRPTYELPLLAEGVDLGGLYILAEHLCRQGMA